MRNGAPEDAEHFGEQSDVHMIVSKQRLTGVEEKIPLWFDPASAQYLERKDSLPRQWVKYAGPIEQSTDFKEAAHG